MAKLGDIIKQKRENMGLSLREFAEKCNVSHSYIRNLEEGNPRTGKDVVPKLNYLEKIAPALGMSMENLLKEMQFIQDVSDRFEPSNLKLIRGKKTYEEISQEIAGSIGERIEPSVYEALEKGHDRNPSALFIDIIAKFANVDRSFFYRKNTPNTLEYARKNFPYKYTQPNEKLPAQLINEYREFLADPANEEYLRFAKELKEKKIKVKLVRDMIFEK